MVVRSRVVGGGSGSGRGVSGVGSGGDAGGGRRSDITGRGGSVVSEVMERVNYVQLGGGDGVKVVDSNFTADVIRGGKLGGEAGLGGYSTSGGGCVDGSGSGGVGDQVVVSEVMERVNYVQLGGGDGVKVVDSTSTDDVNCGGNFVVGSSSTSGGGVGSGSARAGVFVTNFGVGEGGKSGSGDEVGHANKGTSGRNVSRGYRIVRNESYEASDAGTSGDTGGGGGGYMQRVSDVVVGVDSDGHVGDGGDTDGGSGSYREVVSEVVVGAGSGGQVGDIGVGSSGGCSVVGSDEVGFDISHDSVGVSVDGKGDSPHSGSGVITRVRHRPLTGRHGDSSMRQIFISRVDPTAHRYSIGGGVWRSSSKTSAIPSLSLQMGVVQQLSEESISGFREERVKEKAEMQGLNERLANYFQKVHYLETENQRLHVEIEYLHSRQTDDVQSTREAYEAELKYAQKVIDELTVKEGVAHAKVQGLNDQICRLNELVTTHESQATDYRIKLTAMEVHVSQMEGELTSLRMRLKSREEETNRQRDLVRQYQDQLAQTRDSLETSTAAQITSESLMQTRTEELSFYKNLLNQLEIMKPEPVQIEGMNAAEFWQSHMKKAVREIQEACSEKLTLMQQEQDIGETQQYQEIGQMQDHSESTTIHQDCEFSRDANQQEPESKLTLKQQEIQLVTDKPSKLTQIQQGQESNSTQIQQQTPHTFTQKRLGKHPRLTQLQQESPSKTSLIHHDPQSKYTDQMSAMITDEDTGSVQQSYSQDLVDNDVRFQLEEHRSMYSVLELQGVSSQIKETLRHGMETVTVLTGRLEQQQTLYSELESQVRALRSDRDRYAMQVCDLETQLRDERLQYEDQRLAHQDQRLQYEDTISKLQLELSSAMEQLREVVEAKLSLELEIACYKKLLENEETRSSVGQPEESGLEGKFISRIITTDGYTSIDRVSSSSMSIREGNSSRKVSFGDSVFTGESSSPPPRSSGGDVTMVTGSPPMSPRGVSIDGLMSRLSVSGGKSRSRHSSSSSAVRGETARSASPRSPPRSPRSPRSPVYIVTTSAPSPNGTWRRSEGSLSPRSQRKGSSSSQSKGSSSSQMRESSSSQMRESSSSDMRGISSLQTGGSSRSQTGGLSDSSILKMRVRRASKGPVGFAKVDFTGGNVVIENDGLHPQSKCVNLSGWRVQKLVKSHVTAEVLLTDFSLAPGGQFTVWAQGAKHTATAVNEIIADCVSFGEGSCDWKLLDIQGSEKASLAANYI